jgi:alpha/beta superfamily hydrolase
LRLASQQPDIGRVIAVGFPTKVQDRDFVYKVAVPKHFIQSTHDEFGPRPDFEAFYATVPEPKQITWIEAADHFFREALDEFEAVVEQAGRSRR